MSGDVLNGLRNVDGAPIAPQTGEAIHRPPRFKPLHHNTASQTPLLRSRWSPFSRMADFLPVSALASRPV